MLQMILKILFGQMRRRRKKVYAEDILYPTTVYPIYCHVQSTFKYCLQNKLLKREDIVKFKDLINNSIYNLTYYKSIKFNNDAHEIYKKLKDKSISKANMQMLLDYINQFVIDIPKPIQIIRHLRVLK